VRAGDLHLLNRYALPSMNGVSIKDLTADWRRNPHREAKPKEIAQHVRDAHEAMKQRIFTNPVVLAHTAPVSPGLALAAWNASEEAKAAPKPQQPRKRWSFSVGSHGFKSFRISATHKW